MIDPFREELLALTEAPKSILRSRRGKKIHRATLYRWTTVGCRSVVLESIQVGGTRCTSREALARFFQRLSERSGTGRGASTQQHDQTEVEKKLDAMGL